MRTHVMSTLLLLAPIVARADTPSDAPREFDVTELDLSGGVEWSVVQRVLDETATAMSRCVAQAPVRPTGTVTLRFRIDDQGAVSGVSETGVPSLSTCLASAIKALAFGVPPRGKVDVTEKLALRPRTTGILGAPRARQDGAFAPPTGTGDRSGADADVAGRPNGQPTAKVAVVEPGAPEGALADAAQIRARIEHDLPEILPCYEVEAPRHAEFAGTVTVRFHVNATGTVTKAVASGLEPINSCVATRIVGLRFDPPTSGELDVTYPFGFKTEPARDRGIGGIAGRGPGWSVIGSVTLGQLSAKGDLDPATIRRYIKRQVDEIQYCYDKELRSAPKLAGTMTVTFRIEADGKVSSATAAGLGKVGACVVRIVHGIEFPRPKDGGAIDVSYPFEMKPPS